MTVPDKGLGIGTVPLETYRRTLGAWDTTASQLRIRGYADESDNWIYLDLAGSCDLDLTRSRSSFDSSHSLDPICLHFGGLVTAYSYLHGRILTCFRVTGYLHPRRYVLPRPLPHPPFICQAKTIMLLVIYGKQKHGVLGDRKLRLPWVHSTDPIGNIRSRYVRRGTCMCSSISFLRDTVAGYV